LARTFTSQNLKNSDMLNDLKQVIKIWAEQIAGRC
jgi:hypothetical protein